MEPQITPSFSFPHPHASTWRLLLCLSYSSVFKVEGLAALGVWTVGISYWDDIHICLRPLHYLSNTSVGNGKWQYGKQPTAISSCIMWWKPRRLIIMCLCAETATTENIFATKKCIWISFHPENHFKNYHPSMILQCSSFSDVGNNVLLS